MKRVLGIIGILLLPWATHAQDPVDHFPQSKKEKSSCFENCYSINGKRMFPSRKALVGYYRAQCAEHQVNKDCPRYKKWLGLHEKKGFTHPLELEGVFQTLKNSKTIPHPEIEDGCYARAHQLAQSLEDLGYGSEKIFLTGPVMGTNSEGRFVVPKKAVFQPKTNNGSIPSWRYHVANRVWLRGTEDQWEPWIFDMSLFSHPVPEKKWLQTVAPGRTCQPAPKGEDWNGQQKANCAIRVAPRWVYLPTGISSTPTWRIADLVDSDMDLEKAFANLQKKRDQWLRLKKRSQNLPPEVKVLFSAENRKGVFQLIEKEAHSPCPHGPCEPVGKLRLLQALH